MRWLRNCAILALLASAAWPANPRAAATDEKRPRASAEDRKPPEKRGLEIVQHGGYPEMRVDGEPFFVHSAAFFYTRIPRDLWENSLDRYHDLGINTIDLYIPWNWHEPREGEFDFDGHTNPRRDLRGLLRILARKGFRLIARPGPTILNEWRHGGYPEWLLERPAYGMSALDWIEGRYPPLANLNTRNAEEAARGWLENPIHMEQARKWLAAVGKELAAFRAGATLTVSADGKGKAREVGGPLLFVQIEDDLAIGRNNFAGPVFWRYVDEMCKALEAGRLETPCFINPEDMRVSAAGSRLERPIGVMGQWYLQPGPGVSPGGRILTAADASTLEFYAETLETQPAFPPLLIEYQAGWYAPGDDGCPPVTTPANTLLSTRLLLGHGLHGLNHFPLQDTLFPAGYETPWANRHYCWDAAFTLNGFRQPRARAIERTAQLLAAWGGFLAGSHKRADFGLVYPLGSFPQEKLGKEDIALASRTVLRLERLAHLAGLSTELLDPEYQPVEQLLRHALVLMPVLDPAAEKFRMSERAEQALVDYVRRGGILVCFPYRPAGGAFDELWKARPPEPQALKNGATAWPFGRGRMVEATKDFYSWVDPEEDFAESRARFEADWSIGALRAFLSHAGARPAVARTGPGRGSTALVATELVSNEGTGLLGARAGGSGLLSVTNLDYDAAVEETLQVLSPRAGAVGRGGDFISLHVALPPRESLLLPLDFPLCAAAPPGEACDDEVILAGAELLRAERDGKTLELTFYAPARAKARFRLRSRPSRVTLEETRPEAMWTPESRELEVEIPRGVAPEFLRVLRLRLNYTPAVPPRPESGHGRGVHGQLIHYSAVGAVRLPLGEDTSLVTDPPLFAISAESADRLLIAVENLDDNSHDVEMHVEGPLRGTAALGVPAHEFRSIFIKLRSERGFDPPAGPSSGKSLVGGELSVSALEEHSKTPVYFALIPGKGAAGYRFDFDRDGSDEWVLENSGLRLIVSPDSGGRAVALVDKASGSNLASTVGLLADHFAYTPNAPGGNPARARGRYGLFNRSYRGAWLPGPDGPALRLSYDAPDIAPAGARLEKTVRLVGPQHFDVEYSVALEAPSNGNAASGFPVTPLPENTKQAFVAVQSVPARAAGEQSTQFCWQEAASAPAGDSSGPPHCEPFVPGRDALVLPASATRLELRTPGRPGLALEWKNARMTVVMKNYSALLRLEFPPLEAGGAAQREMIHFTVLSSE